MGRHARVVAPAQLHERVKAEVEAMRSALGTDERR
jgi:predicted DNA-binding transcriptional regulator YafY